MERKAFIILYILIATQSTITDSTLSTTTPAESSSTAAAASSSSASSFSASALLEFSCNETFTPELKDSSSQTFKDRAKHVQDNLEAIYKLKYPSFIRAHVVSFRAGSIITSTVLVFNVTQGVPSEQEITSVLQNDQISGLNMSSVSVTVNNTAGTISTAEPMTPPGSSNTTASKTTLPSETPSSTQTSTVHATSTTTGSSEATSSLAGSSTASALNTTASKSISPTSAAFHNTTTSSTNNATASKPTASTFISAGSVSAASASSTNATFTTTATSALAVSFNTTATTVLSSNASKPTAVSVTNTSTSTTGPTTEVSTTVPEIITDLEFHSSDTFTNALDNSESQEFKNRSKLVTDQLEAVYKPKYVNFLRAIVQGFRPGSIITKTQLVFSSNRSVPSRKEISDSLVEAVETGNIKPLNIIPQTISINGSTFATPAAPSTETTASRASKTELYLLQITCLIIMQNILRLFL